MKARHWLLGMAMVVSASAMADVDASGDDLDRLAQGMARSMAGAYESVARQSNGMVKWAGVWMNKGEACPNGRLGDNGRRLVAEGSRFAGDHGAHLILFAPRADTPAMKHDTKVATTQIEVRDNDLIGEHCYLVIKR